MITSAKYKQLEDGTIIIEFPTKFPATNGPDGLLRMGPSKYATKRNWWSKVIKELDIPPAPKPCILMSARFFAKQPLDADSAVSATKMPMDALVHAGVLESDDLDHVVDNVARQYKVATIKEEKTIIVLRPVLATDPTQRSEWTY